MQRFLEISPFILLTIILKVNAIIIENAQQPFYTAAVVEYAPRTDSNDLEALLQEHLDHYKNIAEQAREKHVNILVYPEYGLMARRGDVSLAIEIISDKPPYNNTILTKLSQIAVNNRMYLVVNLIEKKEDIFCKLSFKYYSTNLVFDRSGNIIAKYHKHHLQDDHGLTKAKLKFATFTTDFGVTFATFIYADILKVPNLDEQLLSLGITDIAYNHRRWNSLQVSFIPAVVFHSSFAFSHRVNFLSASYNDRLRANTGSGIYLANGTILDAFVGALEEGEWKLLVQQVPKNTVEYLGHPFSCYDEPQYTNHGNFLQPQDTGIPDNMRLWRANWLRNSKLVDVPKENGSYSEHACHKQFCCSFSFTMTQVDKSSNESYKLLVYNPNLSGFHYRTCTIVTCSNSDDASCGTKFQGSTVFSELLVESNLKTDRPWSFQQLSSSYGLLPFENTFFCTVPTLDGKGQYVRVVHREEVKELLLFGIVGYMRSLV